jgi:uncharacterized damage-inducible protein DinB
LLIKFQMMNTLTILKQLLAYNDWANQRTLRALEQSIQNPPKALRAFTHLLIAEREWLLRLKENKDTTGFDFWQELTHMEVKTLASENSEAYKELIESLTDDELGSVAVYKNSKGIEYRTLFKDILTHVFLHSAYHRGQVALAMREAGGVPAYTDYIAFVRESEGVVRE